MNTTIVVLGAVSTLVGAIAGAAAALWTSRSTARKTDAEGHAITAKTPAEVDSVVVQGAEAAVLTMGKALESAQRRITDLEAEADRREEERKLDRRRMAELEREVEALRRKVDEADKHLREARTAGERLAGQLRDALAQQDGRKRP